MASEPLSWHAAFDHQALATPNVVATVSWNASACRRHAFTYAEVQQRSRDLAGGLAYHLDDILSRLTEPVGDPPARAHRDRIAAVHIPRVHEDFMPVMLALSRLGLPFVLLSSDIPDKSLENARNMYILEALRPCVRLVASRALKTVLDYSTLPGSSAGEVIALDEIIGHDAQAACLSSLRSDTCQILCYMFTGGTQRTKIVKTTHAMLLHERSAYKELWRPQSRPIVLAHTSVYWGASALGQMSIAFAFAGTVVWTDSHEVAELLKCVSEESVTVLGLVPDHLDLLAPQLPERELPSIEAVFTWGERLPRRLIDRWRSHPRAVMRELLIATEYWLTFWSDPLNDDGTLRSVAAADVLVLAEDGSSAKMGEVGTLCIGGPMVMAGYHSLPNGHDPVASCFHFDGDRRFLRTSDLVRRVPTGIVYKGRADMMAKDKGKWVDMLAIEDKVLRIEKVSAVKIIPDPVNEYFHAFLVLESGSRPGPVLDAVRVHLPRKVQLWIVPELPRHPVTRKIDVKRLLEMRAEAWVPYSWPIEGDPSFAKGSSLYSHRLASKMINHINWTLISFTLSIAVAQSSTSLPLGVAACWLLVHAYVWNSVEDKRRRAFSTLVVSVFWCLATLYIQLYSGSFFESVVSLGTFTYGWLFGIYIDEQRQQKRRFGTMLMNGLDCLPFQKIGVFVFLSCFQHRLDYVGWFCKFLLYCFAGFGVFTALRTRRLIAWPVILWCLGGHQMEIDCGFWIRSGFLWNQVMWWRYLCYTFICDFFGIAFILRHAKRLIADRRKGGRGWTPRPHNAGSNQPACGTEEIRILESEALSWIEAFFSDKTDAKKPYTRRKWSHSILQAPEPPTKRQRTEAPRNDPVGEELPLHTSLSCLGQASVGETNGNQALDNEREATLAVKRRKCIEMWWWYNHKAISFDLSLAEERHIAASLCSVNSEGNGSSGSNENGHMEVETVCNSSPEAGVLCSIIAQIEPELKPVNLNTVLMGLDSLRIVRLSNAIKAQLLRSIPASRLRTATTVSKLVELVLDTEEDARTECEASSCTDAVGDTFAVWFSPGQYSPMGNWVLRSDERVDHRAMTQAVQQLVDRHPGTRVKIIDDVRYMSMLYDAASLFSLYAPWMDSLGWFFRRLRCLISWALTLGWPRIQVCSREEVYRSRFPETATPLTVLSMSGGQDYFEFILKKNRFALKPPAGVTLYELSIHLEDAWTWCHGWEGKFVIMRTPDHLAAVVGSKFVYVDSASKEWGTIVDPSSEMWRPPPYGFPALFFVSLSNGAVMWLRMEREDELRACYKDGLGTAFPHHCLAAYRTVRQRSVKLHEPVVISFITIGTYHSFSDGSCYMPLVHDLLAFYENARKQIAPPSLPPVGSVFGELERRLFETFNCRSSPMRSSLRGSIFKYKGRGYCHDIGLEPGVVRAITKVASHYRVPLDVAMLGLLVCAMARADRTELLEFTLYVPMRDGVSEAMAVGLYSDWRDIGVSIDFKLATTLGTILQLSHKIQHRQFSVFNALKKPERHVVNIQPLDFEKKSGFVHLGENLWHGGDQLRKDRAKGRDNTMDWVRQPGTFVIEQQDEETWWILLNVAWDERPAAWMRQFLYGFRDALRSFLLDPLALVHQPLPRDHDLLLAYAGEGGITDGSWGPHLEKAAKEAAKEASLSDY